MRKLFIYAFVLSALAGGCSRDIPEPQPSADRVAGSLVISNSISNQRIRAFEEDAYGHIWIGTFRGLNKYDVHEYHQYFCADDSLGLPDNQITDIFSDSRGRLWISTVNGACVFTGAGHFRRISMTQANRNITQMLETRDGRVLFCNSNELMEVDDSDWSLRTVVPDLAQNGDHSCLVAPDGRIWVVNYDGLQSYDPQTFAKAGPIAVPHPVWHQAMRSNGEIWMAGMGRMSVFDTRTGSFKELPAAILQDRRLMRADVNYIFPVDDYSILFSTIADGLFYWRSSSGKVLHQDDAGFPFEVPVGRICTIFRDSHHNLWFGTEDQGYTVSYMYKDQFNSDKYLTDFFSRKSVVSLSLDLDRNLWISTLADGLYVYNLDSKEIRKVDFSRFINNPGIGYLQCSDVFADSHGYLWLAVQGKYQVLRCRYSGGQLQAAGSAFVMAPMTICEDEDGTVWISTTSKTLLKWPAGASAAEYIDPLPGMDVWTFGADILPTGRGRMILGLFNLPFYELDTYRNEAAPIRVSAEEVAKCITRSVFIPTDLYLDSAGDVWMGTVANGLQRYELATGRIEHIADAPCSDICAIQEDRQGNVWVSTQDGLGRYDRTVGTFTNYYADDGVGGNQFYDRAACMLPDGTLVFGGTHGLTMFNPLDVPQKRTVPLVFQDLKVHNELVRPSPYGPINEELTMRPDITLNHHQNGFSISFAALDYSEHERTHYYYMLDGFDHYWIDAGNNREAYYANLPSGKYVFRVRITNNNKSIVESENSLNVRILPSPWLSWWAILLYCLAALGIIWILYSQWKRYALVRKRADEEIRKEKEAKALVEMEKEQEKRLNKLQMNYFANVAHEFRTPLTMISGPVSVLARSSSITGQEKKLLGVVQRSTAWMLNLVNQLLDFNRLDNNKLRLKVSKTEVLEQLRSLCELFRFNAGAKGLEISTHGLEDSFTMWVDSDKMTKIVMNLLSNAMKYTPSGGKVDIGFDVLMKEEAADLARLGFVPADTQYAVISVSDTGGGVPDEEKEKIFERYYQLDKMHEGQYNVGSGIGLYYSRVLAGLHHGCLFVRDREYGLSGSVFVLMLPVSASSYSEEEKQPAETSQAVKFPIPEAEACVEEAPKPDADKKSVLVVDDDIDVANYLKILLSQDYSVATCFDAESALKYIAENAPDVVISDVVMPGKSGYDLCKAIRADIQLSHIPVILVTAKVAVENQVEGLGSGADAYVTKPFDPVYLTALLKSLLENREKMRKRLSDVAGVDEMEEDALSPQDNAFMKELYELMDKELSNQDLDITRITEMMRISRTKFYYKVKGLTGENPSVFFKRYKLNRAARLLLEGKYNMSEIADMTGFNTLSHFSTSFKKQFGVPPSEYRG